MVNSVVSINHIFNHTEYTAFFVSSAKLQLLPYIKERRGGNQRYQNQTDCLKNKASTSHCYANNNILPMSPNDNQMQCL